MGLPVDPQFCYLIEPFGTTTGRTIPHTGDDWARRKINGKPKADAPDVYAVFSGTVVWSGWHGVAGNRIIIRYWHGLYGDYGHLKSLGVKVGQSVTEGERIGELGGTGKATGPHLHYTQSTDLDRLLKGVYPYWKNVKTGRVLWPSVDAWAAASGLRRPQYALPTDKASNAVTPTAPLEEDDMYTDQDRARDDATYAWLQDVQPKVAEIHAIAKRLEIAAGVHTWALTDDAAGLRRAVANVHNAIANLPDSDAQPVDVGQIADELGKRLTNG